MALITPYPLTYYVQESVEAAGLSSAREICLAFKVSESMNLLKHFYKISFSQNVNPILFNISFFFTLLHVHKPVKLA